MSGMIINHNISAMNTLRNLNGSNGSLSKSLEKLSSGYKINTAADDPSGLIISEQLRSQMYGIERAVRNTQEAGNVLSIAEGALVEMNEMLKKMRGLALHAANSGVTALDQIRADQSEVDSAVQTLDRIANTTKYSDQYLLNGSKGLIYSTRSLRGNSLVDTGLTRLDQVFKRDGTIIGINYTGSSTTVGQAAMVNQAERAFYEADAGGTSDVIDDETGFLTQDQEFIITGKLGARQFSFSVGTDVSQVVAAMKNVEASTGVGAALTIGSQGISAIQSNSDLAISLGSTFGAYTQSNSWDLYGLQTGVNTSASGQLYVKAEINADKSVNISLYKSAPTGPGSFLAADLVATASNINPAALPPKGVFEEANSSGISGSVTVNGALISAALAAPTAAPGSYATYSINPATMTNGTKTLTTQYLQTTTTAGSNYTTSNSFQGITGLQDGTTYYALTEAAGANWLAGVYGASIPAHAGAPLIAIFSGSPSTAPANLVGYATGAFGAASQVQAVNNSGLGGSITLSATGTIATTTSAATAVAANAFTFRAEEVPVSANPIQLSAPAGFNVVDNSMFANMTGLENHLGSSGELQVLTIAGGTALPGPTPVGAAGTINVAIYSGLPSAQTYLGYVNGTPGASGVSATFVPAAGITDVSGSIFLHASNPAFVHTGAAPASAAVFEYNSPTAGLINEEDDGADVVESWTLNGVELGKNTDAEGRMHVKMVSDNAAAVPPTFHVEVYKDADMTKLVAKSAIGSEGQTVTLSEQNTSGLAGTINLGDNLSETSGITLRPQLGVRMYSTEYGESNYIRLQANKGSMWEMYDKVTASYKRIDATVNPVTEQVNGQNATISINGTALSVSGTTAEVSTPVFSGSIKFEEGVPGETTMAQVGYDFGGSSGRIGAMMVTTNLHINAGDNNAENIENIRNGMQYQLAENDGDQARTVYGIPSMAVPNIGQIEVDGVTYTLQDVLGGGRASLENEPVLAMKIIGQAINDVSSLRARLGAFQGNMLDSNENALNVALENITKTESALRDADMAAESTEFTKNQILVQAGTAMLAQANVVSQNVLQLLS